MEKAFLYFVLTVVTAVYLGAAYEAVFDLSAFTLGVFLFETVGIFSVGIGIDAQMKRGNDFAA